MTRMASLLLAPKPDTAAVRREMIALADLPDDQLAEAIAAIRRETRFDGAELARAQFIAATVDMLQASLAMPLEVRIVLMRAICGAKKGAD